MRYDLLFGNKKDNVIKKIKEKKSAKCLLVLTWFYLYQVFGIDRGYLLSKLCIIGVLGVITMNLFYIPVRLLQDTKVDRKIKFLFTVLIAIIVMYEMDQSMEVSFFCFYKNAIVAVVTSLVLTFILTCTIKWLGVHSQDLKNFEQELEIDHMEGHKFESYCADVLKEKGFVCIEVTQGSGDFGIDVLAWKGNIKYGIQCKRYEGNVGWHAVEEAHAGAVYYNCDQAVVLTNSYFTKQAKEGADKVGVLLWDREWFM